MAAEWAGQRGVWLKDANLLRSAVLLPGAWGVLAAGGAPAFLSSSSLSDPPEELLSEATRGAFCPSPAGRAPGEALTSADTNGEQRNEFAAFVTYLKMEMC